MASADLVPDERFWIGIVLGEVSIDRSLQVGDSSGRRGGRRMRCRVILEKKFSTALSQEAEVWVQ